MADTDKKVVFNIIDFLQNAKKSSGLSEESAESLDVACQCLSTAFKVDVNDSETKSKFSIAPQTLASLVGSASKGDESDVLESKFSQYLTAATKRGLFKGVTPGLKEYEDRYHQARVKFLQRFAPSTAAPATATPATPPATGPSAVPLSSTHTGATNLNPKAALAENFKAEGNAQLGAKNYQGAVESYTKAINMDSSNAIYFCNRAAAYSHLGEHEKAIADCQTSISLNPAYSKAYGRLGLAFFSLERYQEAIDAYDRGLQLEPNSASLKESKAAAQAKLGSSSSASSSSPSAPSANGLPDIGSLLNNPGLMNSLGGMFGGGQGGQQGGQGGSQPNFADILSNPMFQNMAQQMMTNPGMRQMAENMMKDPSAMNQMMNAFGGGGNGGNDSQNNS